MFFLHDLKPALRGLLRTPAFTLVALLTLALGIGATTAMFATLHAALWKPLPFKEPAQLVLPKTTFKGQENPYTSAPDFFDYREQAGCFEHIIATQGPFKITVTGDRAERIDLTTVSPEFFPMVGTQPVAGRWFSPEESNPGGPAAVIVSEGYARRRFGSPQDALGQSLGVPKLNASFPIVGVAPSNLDLFSITDMWVPWRRGDDPEAENARGSHGYQIFARLKPGVSLEAAQQEVDVIARRLAAQYPDTNVSKGLKINPLQAALLGPEKSNLSLLMGGVSLVLLIACANVAGLMLARGNSRRKELAVRASLGASRGELITQLVAENLVLSILAGLLGIVLAFFLLKVLPAVSGLATHGIPSAVLDYTVLGFTLGISIVTGLLFGVAPAFMMASKRLTQDLAYGKQMTGDKGSAKLRSGMVVTQVALSMVLLITSGLLIRSLARLQSTPLGYDTHQLLTGELEIPQESYPNAAQRIQLLTGLYEELMAVPGVKAVGFISHVPLVHPHGNLGVWTPERPPSNRALGGDMTTANWRIVMPGYFDAMKIPLIAGRDVSSADGPKEESVVVISARMAKTLYPGQSPLGRTVSVDLGGGGQQRSLKVIGVVGNARIDAVGEESRPVMYVPFGQASSRSRMCPMIRTTQDPKLLIQALNKILSNKDPNIPLTPLTSMENRISTGLDSKQVAAATLAMFSVVSLLLASIGLYGVITYLIKQRAQEIAIRMALGAQVRHVVWQFAQQGLILISIGIGIGVLCSLAMGKLLANQLYQVSSADPLSMASASLVLSGVALMVILLPAMEAARVNPGMALKED